MSDTLLQLIGLRGATTCPDNSSDAIHKAVAELIDALVDHNELTAERIVSVTFSVTGDLNACFSRRCCPQSPRLGPGGAAGLPADGRRRGSGTLHPRSGPGMAAGGTAAGSPLSGRARTVAARQIRSQLTAQTPAQKRSFLAWVSGESHHSSRCHAPQLASSSASGGDDRRPRAGSGIDLTPDLVCPSPGTPGLVEFRWDSDRDYRSCTTT